MLLFSIKGRVNFLQLGRFGNFKEQRYRHQYEKPFPWLDFNKELTFSHGGNRFVIAFDPSYISKSGKKTPGLGWYWSYVGLLIIVLLGFYVMIGGMRIRK